MQRRALGVFVVVAALVAAVLAPTLAIGRRLAGEAVPMDFAELPRIGQCALDPLPASTRGRTPVTLVRFGACDARIAGEIVAVFPQRREPRFADSAGRRGTCDRAAARYAGLWVIGGTVLVPGTAWDDRVQWVASTGIDARRIVPDVVEQRAGRTWSACLATPVLRGSYRGGLANAFAGGVVPAAFGLCWPGVDLDALIAPLPCDRPHAAELIATARIPDRSAITRAELLAGCESVVAATMRRGDPTAGGRLTAVLDQDTADGAQTPSDPLSVRCFVAVTPPAMLTGTVVGLADRPLPVDS